VMVRNAALRPARARVTVTAHDTPVLI